MSTKSGPCRCSRLSASLSAALAASFGIPPVLGTDILPAVAMRPAHTLTLTPAGEGDDTSAADEFYLEAVLNQAPTGRLARFVRIDGEFHASAATLRELGLTWPGGETGSGLQRLRDLPGLEARYDAAHQRMLLQVPIEMLDRPVARFGQTTRESPLPDPAMQVPGLVFNYDLYAQRSHSDTFASGFSELRLFGLGPGIWSNTSSHRLSRTDAGRGHGSVRLDTTWRLDFPERMLALSVGDDIAGSVSWSRPTRFGGVRLSRDFSLQPYRVTAPLASFAGEATLPSTVDLFINGIRQSSQQVAPGQFQLDTTPSLSGTGTAQMVVTDINGVIRTVDFQFYGTPQLLQAGLSDWSVELGWVRRDYGLDSFSYADDPMLGASLRRGLVDRFTLEAHAEATRGLEMAGLGGVWLPGPRSGVFSAALAASRDDEAGHGSQRNLGYRWSGRGFSFSTSSTRRSRGFRDAASLEGSRLPLRTEQAFIGFSTPLGHWSTGYVRQEYPDRDPSRYATLNWSKQFPGLNSVHLGLFHDLEGDDDSAWLSWSMPLDRRTRISASARHSDSSQNLAVQAGRAVDGDRGGWGWRVQASQSDGGQRSGQAQVDWLGDVGGWNAGVSSYGGSNSLWTGARGSLLWMAGRAQPMRRADNAFAMVSTSGVAGVPVRLENRLIGETDADGLLLVTRLNPWQRNKLSLDPLALPADMRVTVTEMQAVPAGRSGVLARFPMRRVVSVQLAVRDASGAFIRAGSPVWPADADPAEAPVLTVIGHDGLLFLEDPPKGARYRVGVGGGFCEVALPEVGESTGFVELEGAVCR